MARESRALARAEEQYGVSRTMLAAIWGVELNFGQEMGKRSLVQSLTTLACMGDRANYFRSELMATLKIIDRGDVPAEKLNGSWAGAFGQTQFMPSTFLRLAVDSDGDGRRDIVDSAPDALASTANYLRKSGWRPGLPWGFEVKLPDGYSGPSGRKARQSMSFWAARGVTRIDGRSLGGGDAALLTPAGRNGPAFLVTRNFDAVYSYNAAESYTLAACVLADRLAADAALSRPGRPMICSCRAMAERSCRRSSRGAAMTSAATRTATSGRRARPRSPISSRGRGSRSTAGLRSRCWRR